MIGYVLLISMALIMGGLIYVWIKTYVPSDRTECPDGVSIFIKDYVYDCTPGSEKITLTLKNNGNFDIGGYFIRATTDIDQELATENLAGKLDESIKGMIIGEGVMFDGTGDNPLPPAVEQTHVFDLSQVGDISLVEIVPIRWPEPNIVNSCDEARIRQEVSCTP